MLRIIAGRGVKAGLYLARTRRDDPREDLQKRALACPVGTQKSDLVTALDDQVYPGIDKILAIGFSRRRAIR